MTPALQAVFSRNDFLRATLVPFDALCLTVWGEARAETPLGMRAVAKTILNRVSDGRWGRTVNNVVFYKWQFSCWVPAGGAENYQALQDLTQVILQGRRPSSKSFDKVRSFIEPVYSLQEPVNEVGKATHYITNALRVSNPPAWVKDPSTKLVCVIGNHTFYEAR